MIAPLLFALSGLAFQQKQVLWMQVTLPMPAKSDSVLIYRGPTEPLDSPKRSPQRFGAEKRQWDFYWMLEGLTQTPVTGVHSYFRVYSQEHKTVGDKAPQVMRMLLRLWLANLNRLNLTHSPQYSNGIVDVYLCFGGKAGGEQLLDVDHGLNTKTQKTVDIKVNTIYIYDTNSFTDPVEMAREVAHEYGHASLPPVGGFTDPEDWAGGYLGEKIYLRWMRDALASNELSPDDVMGASKAGLDKWVAVNVDPLVLKAAQTLPTSALLADKSANGMNAYLGLALYIESLYSDSVFGRSIKMTGSYEAKDYPAAVLLAAEEAEKTTLKIPSYLVGKEIWIPLGTGKLAGTVALQKDPSGWVKIKAHAGTITITNSH